VQDSTYHPIELDNRYTMPGEDEPRTVPGPGLLRVLPYPKVETHMPSVAPVGFNLTETDPDVTDVLTLLDRPRRGARWVELFKVLEIIKSDGNILAVRTAAGVSNNKIERFTRTANHHRASGLEDARHPHKRGTSAQADDAPRGQRNDLLAGSRVDTTTRRGAGFGIRFACPLVAHRCQPPLHIILCGAAHH
jgi:hypothetical protein